MGEAEGRRNGKGELGHRQRISFWSHAGKSR